MTYEVWRTEKDDWPTLTTVFGYDRSDPVPSDWIDDIAMLTEGFCPKCNGRLEPRESWGHRVFVSGWCERDRTHWQLVDPSVA